MNIGKVQNEFYKKFYKIHNNISVSDEYQKIRYEKLSNMFKMDNNFSIHDIGMGLGGFLEYLNNSTDKKFSYSGSEINEEFYNICSKRYPDNKFYLRNLADKAYEDKYDYLIMNAIFNTKENVTITEWEKYIFRMISNAYSMANKGIAFSILTEFCDFYEKNLYYCKLYKLLNYINDNLSRFFEIQQSYPLYEMTVFVYKVDYIKEIYNEKCFKKYFK